MKKAVTSLFILAILSCSGCVAALVGGAVAGGYVYHDAKKRESRESFMSNFRYNNLEREKSGLIPLDICTEKYHFDRKWAREDYNCRRRINKYEAGDLSALPESK